LRYLHLIKAIARYRLARELEFPASFFVSIGIHSFFIVANLLFFMLIWYRVGGFGGLTPMQMLFFIGTFHVADGVFTILAFFGIMEIPELIRNGDMDFLLAKPVSSQFFVTFRSFSWFAIFDFLVGLVIVIYTATQLQLSFTGLHILTYSLMVINGAAVSYAMSCLVMTLAFKMVAVDAVWTIFFELGEFERQPMGIYPPAWKMLFSIVIPQIMVANFPAYFGMGKLAPWQLVFFIGFGVLLVCLSHRFWQYALKKYQSASS
jgi:ABC-2 type transport system permease protein